jgi:hypothetical protein
MSGPMRRLATPVIWMTPLFWAKVVLGKPPVRGKDTREPVGDDASTEPRPMLGPICVETGELRGGGHVAERFEDGNEIDKRERDQQRPTKSQVVRK